MKRDLCFLILLALRSGRDVINVIRKWDSSRF